MIDTAARAVVCDIDLGNPFFGILGGDLAVAPDGRHVYVTGDRDTITVIETAANEVAARIPTPNGFAIVTGVTFSHDGRQAFVLVQRGEDAGIMCVVDTAAQAITDQIGLSIWPFGVEISPDGKRVYVSHSADSGMVVDLTTQQTQVLPFPFEGQFWTAITPDGEHAYVGRSHNNDVWFADLVNGTTTTAFLTQRNIGDVVITPNGRRVYVSQGGGHGSEPNVMVVDTATNDVTCCPASWFNAQPRGMAITPDGKYVYVTDSRHRKVVIVPVPEDPTPPV
ncbi:SMP-30/gluconolactonase/LRE family protein [Streptomyces sp. NPDC054945]